MTADGPAPEGLTWAVMTLTVTVRDANASDDDPFRPACGDALRIRFTSHRALFAPRRARCRGGARPRRRAAAPNRRAPRSCSRCLPPGPWPPRRQREAACGVHALRFIVPPDAPAYRAEVWVVHVDGEGMGEPPMPRLHPINLMAHQDGPRLFNLRADGFPGRLRVPARYVRGDPDAPGDAFDLRSAARPAFAMPAGAARAALRWGGGQGCCAPHARTR